MVLELGDQSVVKNDATGMACDLEFKTKVCCLSLTALHFLKLMRAVPNRDSSLDHVCSEILIGFDNGN